MIELSSTAAVALIWSILFGFVGLAGAAIVWSDVPRYRPRHRRKPN